MIPIVDEITDLILSRLDRNGCKVRVSGGNDIYVFKDDFYSVGVISVHNNFLALTTKSHTTYINYSDLDIDSLILDVMTWKI